MTARCVPAAHDMGAITTTIDTSGSHAVLYMHLGGIGSPHLTFEALAELDELIAACCLAKSELGEAVGRWQAAQVPVLPVRALPPAEYATPEPFVPLVHYLADDETMPCGAQSAPGLTVTATTDPADVTCGLCATSAECREAASCRPCGPGGIGLCAGCQDAEAAELAYMEEHHPVALATVGTPGLDDEPPALDGDGEEHLKAFNAAHDAEDARVDAEQAQAGAE